MKLRDLQGLQLGVSKFMNEKIDFKLAYRLTKIIKKIEPELLGLEEARKKLIEKYGEKTETGGQQVKPENIESFSKDFNELLNQDVVVEFDPIPLDLLEKIETIETQVLLALEPFIKKD